ncbi:MAG: glycosyltransferase family 2 protein [Candidatus Omnitrophica bacterium]|nr:glycosyltransferase family 2 protein [Candidatus Omnitrophota bacterium]
MTDKYLVDIIILNFNQEADTAECILSLRRSNYKNYNIILVDNNSSDGSGFRLKERFKDIVFLRNGENLGFAAGCNLGLRHSLENSQGGYVLFLNNDTVVGESFLSELLGVAETEKSIGIVGAVSYYYALPDNVHMAGHKFFWWLGIQGVLREIGPRLEEVQSVSACCMLVKKEVFRKIGLLDERFFIYYEDADLCLRARRAGFKVAAARDAKVWHKINKIFGTKTAKEYYIYARNQPLFMLKNCPKIFLLNYFIVYALKVLVRAVYFFITFRMGVSIAILRGSADFLTRNFGKGRLFA